MKELKNRQLCGGDAAKKVIQMPNEKLYLAETIADYLRENSGWLCNRDKRTLGHLRRDIVCKFSPIGAYRCYTKINFSVQSGRDSIAVDTCLQHEIYELLQIPGITTIGCCCGHGIEEPYIQVTSKSVRKMQELGYTEITERDDGSGKWCFRPMTYFPEPLPQKQEKKEGEKHD